MHDGKLEANPKHSLYVKMSAVFFHLKSLHSSFCRLHYYNFFSINVIRFHSGAALARIREWLSSFLFLTKHHTLCNYFLCNVRKSRSLYCSLQHVNISKFKRFFFFIHCCFHSCRTLTKNRKLCK